jgi:hypothetical protein
MGESSSKRRVSYRCRSFSSRRQSDSGSRPSAGDGAGGLPFGFREDREDGPRSRRGGAKAVSGTSVVLKRVGEVAADDLLSSDAVIVGSPVYFGNMSGEVKTFFDNWNLKFRLSRERRMGNKVGAAFATSASISSGKEITILTIVGAMLLNQMIVISGGGGFSVSATTGPTCRALTTTNWQTLVTWASASPRSLL